MSEQRITAEELRHKKCGAPGCTDPSCILILNAKCHPGAGTTVTYHGDAHTLRIACNKCDRHVVTIALGASEVSRG